ncbi:hypothetical protein CHLNCDRAFT_139137 [Chlorella variabilis]|uniref:Uncharacterized protein n=1 Tax=Chlorella variabilis TaxID=554065 RepID=E1ZPI8_CHLVA|nr:hypothetical protein CHLNCDRAFT_139137 [Chlorella variabilis]EFN52331.1 hypothetical protein CHLNCDRAFT_139137 [Chlorella variabilis]|eukprot:XP_005844433.1 hypothetical protein CHLNCDRAFT_139137 [Chlorella variabilis]
MAMAAHHMSRSTNGQNRLVNAPVTKAFAVCPMKCFSVGGDIYGSKAAYRSNARICLAAYVNGLASYKNVTAFGITSKTAAASPNAFNRQQQQAVLLCPLRDSD